MNNGDEKVDRSVKFLQADAKEANAGKWKSFVPMFPISTIEALKAALTRRLKSEYAGVATRMVYQAVNEACAAASQTLEPLLFLPALAEEKVQEAAAWTKRQGALLQGRCLDCEA